MKSVALAACAVMILSPSVVAQSDNTTTTVILVRHAEKQSTGDDPSLTAAGRERAQALVHVLGEVDIAAVYSTPYARTRQTAQPLAVALGLEVTERPARNYGSDMAEWIRANHTGDVVVAVSHSNTVPALIEALGARPVPTIEDHEYDDLYVVTIDAEGNATLLAMRYGRETP
jgi:2,3-bisphosphoglycerate-dependent phosphoglycerate mutase